MADIGQHEKREFIHNYLSFTIKTGICISNNRELEKHGITVGKRVMKQFKEIGSDNRDQMCDELTVLSHDTSPD